MINTIQYNTNTIQYNTIQYNTIQHNTTQYNTIQYNTIQYNTIQYNTIQYNIDKKLHVLLRSMSFRSGINCDLRENNTSCQEDHGFQVSSTDNLTKRNLKL